MGRISWNINISIIKFLSLTSALGFPLSRDFSNLQVPRTFRVSRSCPGRTTGPSRSLGPVLPGPRDLGPFVPGVPGVLAGPNHFPLFEHLWIVFSAGKKFDFFHTASFSHFVIQAFLHIKSFYVMKFLFAWFWKKIIQHSIVFYDSNWSWCDQKYYNTYGIILKW